ncbi:MAG: L-histidine N(alpha)-methyltransferase [bacterium]
MFENFAVIERESSFSTKEKDEQFAKDVLQGLKSSTKYLPSKYFYNEKGDLLFQKIMELEEYYLTKAEYNILNKYKEKIGSYCQENDKNFNLIELGAGDGMKTKLLLNHFLENKMSFSYLPIDISGNALSKLKNELQISVPELKLHCMQGDYFACLEKLSHLWTDKNIILFLGSSIGNFNQQEALEFFIQVHQSMKPHDLLLTGFDLKKDPRIVLNAYNDKEGVTKDFNLNLLERINKELNADFDVSTFDHFPVYDPVSGLAKSYLISNKSQYVHIADLKMNIKFNKSEPILMEISRKYDISSIEKMAHYSGFEIIDNFTDENNFFVNSLWKHKEMN